MTQDQIKALAEEYAKSVCANDKYENISERQVDEEIEYDFALSVIQWLNDKYCIVEREEVFRLLNNAKMLEWDSSRDFNIIGQAAIKVLEDLFGTSMFNQNEE